MGKELLEYAKKFDKDFIKVKLIGKWNDYNVYEPIRKRKGVCFTGRPLRLLEKDGKIRWTSPDEALKLFHEMET